MDKSKTFLRIAVTVPYFYEGEARDIASRLSDGGFSYVHIRKPRCSTPEMERLVLSVDPVLRKRLILHDCHDMAAQWGVGGVQLNSRTASGFRPAAGLIVTRSAHSLEECLSSAGCDYVTLSPIFPSISKPGYLPSIDRRELAGYLAGGDRPVTVALGGVTYDNEATLRAMGFDGAAMLADAWRCHIDPLKFGLQLITDPVSVSDATRQAVAALDGGCRWIQLRWKDAPEEVVAEAAIEIRRLCDAADAVLILDDHVQLVKCTGADGVHLGRNDMPVDEARRIIGPGHIIGATANTHADILAAARAGADYIGFGPFRFTTTKKNLSPVLGLDGYRAAVAYCREAGITLPIVAIGGITLADIEDIMHTGAGGIAMSGAINNAADPAEATRQILKPIKKALIWKN
ncbi:MAG: thiamine phosphate synthase [Candidatus Amulumruptor sp.]|nr:thiamine phosphate synthase [Candidatus Amulumruptor sp.]